MNTRLIFLSLAFITVIVISFAPTHSKATQSATIWAWCMSDTSAPTVYFAGPFDSGMTARTGTFNALSLGRQFAEYLKGRFDIKGDPSGVTAASCGHGVNTLDRAAASQRMREVMAQMRQQNKQVVEVTDWDYIRDEVAITASFNTRPREQGAYVNVEGGLPPDHIYCVTGSFNNTVYYAEPIRVTNPSDNPSVSYFRFLQQKYLFKGGDFTCPMINEPQAKMYLTARLAGARAGGKQVVNTGWPPANFATAAQAPNDRYQDNDQPAQRPNANPRPSQSQAISAITMQALASCAHDPAMGRAYICTCLQTSMHDYLVKHPAELSSGTLTAASLLGSAAYQPETCLNDNIAKTVAREQASSAGLKSPAALNCAAEKFVAALHANPTPSKAQAELDGAIKMCR